MYVLPNGKKIDEDILLKAFLDLDPDILYFLDAETGEILRATGGEVQHFSEQPGRYFKVSKLTDAVYEQWMLELTSELISSEDPELAIKLFSILKGKDPVKNFYAAIEGNWSYGWPQWEQDKCFVEIEKWLDDLPFMVEDDWQDFFEENCDCPICKVMAEGLTDEKSLKDAFRKANFNQVMGGIYKSKE